MNIYSVLLNIILSIAVGFLVSKIWAKNKEIESLEKNQSLIIGYCNRKGLISEKTAKALQMPSGTLENFKDVLDELFENNK